MNIPAYKTIIDHRAIAIVLVFAVFIIYAPTLGGGFSWDEKAIFENGRSEYFVEFFEYMFLRPMPNSLFGFELKLWGDVSWPYHLLNIVLHSLNVAAVYVLGLRLMLSKRASALAATIFALHPACTESVSWIWGRPELLKTLFFNTAFISYIAYRKEGSWQALASSGLFFLLAMLSGQAAIVLAVIVLLYEAVIADAENRTRTVWAVVGLMSAITAYLILLPGRGEIHPSLEFNRLRIFDILTVLGFYCVKLIAPYSQTLLPEFSISTALFMASFVLPAAAALLFWDGRRMMGMLLMMSFLSLVPAALIIQPDIRFPLGLRQLYMPLAPICIVFAVALDNIRNKRALILIVGIVIIALAWSSATRTLQWKSPERIWADTAAKSDRHSAAWINYAASLAYSGRQAEARLAISEAFNKPEMTLTEFQKASKIYAFAGGMKHENDYLSMVTAARDVAYANYGLGYLYYNEYMKGNKAPVILEKAIQHLTHAIELSPKMIEANFHVGMLYLRIGESDKALHHLGVVNSVLAEGKPTFDVKQIIDRINKSRTINAMPGNGAPIVINR